MQIRKILRNAMILTVVMCNIGCDQISKTIVRQQVDYNESIKVISDNFTLTRVENTGAFLSLGSSLPLSIKFLILSLIPSIALLLGLYFLITKTGISQAFIIGSCFVIGGGFGNLYDRLVYGSVTDFFHIDFVVFQTGVFNMADVSIMIGVLILFIQLQMGKTRNTISG